MFPGVAVTVSGAPGIAVKEGVIEFEVAAGPVPNAFVAVTLKVYAVPLVKPVTVMGLEVPVVIKPVFAVTVYDVIGLPFETGAVKLTVALALPADAVTPIGAPGAVNVPGVTLFEIDDRGPVPTALVAVTLNVYAVPLVNPVTIIGLVAPVAVLLPGLDVTVYDAIGLVPLEKGAVKLTVARPLPSIAFTPVGAPGTEIA